MIRWSAKVAYLRSACLGSQRRAARTTAIHLPMAEHDAAIGPCGPGVNAKCGDTCVDTNSDFQNCGECGTACRSDQVCSHGACATVCGGGAVRCGNNCIDTQADVNNCGGCDKPCASGQVCSKGTCALTCQSGLTNCNGDCVDVTQNDDNCGACGKPVRRRSSLSEQPVRRDVRVRLDFVRGRRRGRDDVRRHATRSEKLRRVQHAVPAGLLLLAREQRGHVRPHVPRRNDASAGTSASTKTSTPTTAAAARRHAPATRCCAGGHCCPTNQIYCGGCDTVPNCIKKSGGASPLGVRTRARSRSVACSSVGAKTATASSGTATRPTAPRPSPSRFRA